MSIGLMSVRWVTLVIWLFHDLVSNKGWIKALNKQYIDGVWISVFIGITIT